MDVVALLQISWYHRRRSSLCRIEIQFLKLTGYDDEMKKTRNAVFLLHRHKFLHISF